MNEMLVRHDDYLVNSARRRAVVLSLLIGFVVLSGLLCFFLQSPTLHFRNNSAESISEVRVENAKFVSKLGTLLSHSSYNLKIPFWADSKYRVSYSDENGNRHWSNFQITDVVEGFAGGIYFELKPDGTTFWCQYPSTQIADIRDSD